MPRDPISENEPLELDEEEQGRTQLANAPAERFSERAEWPEPAEEPREEPADDHQGPLDDIEDGRFLSPFDPRRVAAEQRRGQPFGEDRSAD